VIAAGLAGEEGLVANVTALFSVLSLNVGLAGTVYDGVTQSTYGDGDSDDDNDWG
jgi:hypothetical protein